MNAYELSYAESGKVPSGFTCSIPQSPGDVLGGKDDANFDWYIFKDGWKNNHKFSYHKI